MREFVITEHEHVDHVLSCIMGTQRPVHVTVMDEKEYKGNKPKSSPQNRELHKWFRIISKAYYLAHGKEYDVSIWKEYFKKMFLGEEIIELPGGERITRIRRMRDLTKKEAMEFREQILHYVGSEMWEYGIILERDYESI